MVWPETSTTTCTTNFSSSLSRYGTRARLALTLSNELIRGEQRSSSTETLVRVPACEDQQKTERYEPVMPIGDETVARKTHTETKICCSSFQRSPPATATRKTEHVSKPKPPQIRKPKKKTKRAQKKSKKRKATAERREEGGRGRRELLERVRRVRETV